MPATVAPAADRKAHTETYFTDAVNKGLHVKTSLHNARLSSSAPPVRFGYFDTVCQYLSVERAGIDSQSMGGSFPISAVASQCFDDEVLFHGMQTHGAEDA